MTVSTATVATPNAASTMRKLCRHWAHKFQVQLTESQGLIELPQATCQLSARPEALSIRLETQDADQARLQTVVEEHLQRFAFQEELVFVWTPA